MAAMMSAAVMMFVFHSSFIYRDISKFKIYRDIYLSRCDEPKKTRWLRVSDRLARTGWQEEPGPDVIGTVASGQCGSRAAMLDRSNDRSAGTPARSARENRYTVLQIML
jgi:hypothetical protein